MLHIETAQYSGLRPKREVINDPTIVSATSSRERINGPSSICLTVGAGLDDDAHKIEVDGVYADMTVHAVEHLQRELELQKITGNFGPEELKALNAQWGHDFSQVPNSVFEEQTIVVAPE